MKLLRRAIEHSIQSFIRDILHRGVESEAIDVANCLKLSKNEIFLGFAERLNRPLRNTQFGVGNYLVCVD